MKSSKGLASPERHDVAPDSGPNRNQTQTVHFLLSQRPPFFVAMKVGRRLELPIDPIDPGVIGTGDSPAPGMAGFVYQARAPVSTQVVEDPHPTLFVPGHEQGLPGDTNGKEIAGVGHVLTAGDAGPTRSEHLGNLGLVYILIAVGQARQGAPGLVTSPDVGKLIHDPMILSNFPACRRGYASAEAGTRETYHLISN